MAASDSNTTNDELEFSNASNNSHESLMDLFYEWSSFEEPLAIGNSIQPYQFEPSDESSDSDQNTWEIDSLEIEDGEQDRMTSLDW